MTKYFFCCILFISVACQRYLIRDYNEEKIKQRYEQGLDATSDIAKEQVANDLRSPILDSTALVWNTIRGEAYILTVMWKKAGDTAYYKNDCVTGFSNTKNRYNFVTLVPDLKNACRNKHYGNHEGVNLRLEQALGIPPHSQKKWFIEAWVRPQDLIRPCRDPQTDDRTCSKMMGDTLDPEYKAFVSWLATNNQGYPFTQLGYTYDWNQRNKTHEGFSEFLIDKQSNIVIKDYIETCDYCFVQKMSKIH